MPKRQTKKTVRVKIAMRGASSAHCKSVRDAVLKHNLDRRRVYSVYADCLVTNMRATDDCSGCTEFGDYGTRYGPFGCKECGYTGKRVRDYPEPVFVNRELVRIETTVL